MKIVIFNHSNLTKSKVKRQSKVSVDFELVCPVLVSYLKKNPHLTGVKDLSINLTLCGKGKIKSLNKLYRKKDKITDVLSFGVHDNLRPDLGPFMKNLAQLDLGDIFICKEVAASQAKEFSITLDMEIIHLFVHGFLHLLGFDHEISQKEEKLMEKEEMILVKKIYKKLGIENE